MQNPKIVAVIPSGSPDIHFVYYENGVIARVSAFTGEILGQARMGTPTADSDAERDAERRADQGYLNR